MFLNKNGFLTGSLLVSNLRKAMKCLMLRLHEVTDLSRYLAAFMLNIVSVATVLTETAVYCTLHKKIHMF